MLLSSIINASHRFIVDERMKQSMKSLSILLRVVVKIVIVHVISLRLDFYPPPTFS
jgi:hypothetical protein